MRWVPIGLAFDLAGPHGRVGKQLRRKVNRLSDPSQLVCSRCDAPTPECVRRSRLVVLGSVEDIRRLQQAEVLAATVHARRVSGGRGRLKGGTSRCGS